jgi:hypothetical protein
MVEHCVVGSEVMVADDFTRLKRSRPILPTSIRVGNEVGYCAMVGRYCSSNLGEQLVTPERSGPRTHGGRRISFDIAKDLTTLSIETARLRNEQESAVTNMLEELMHILVPGLCGSTDGITVAHDGGDSAAWEPFFWSE